jgi:hypothetical protein
MSSPRWATGAGELDALRAENTKLREQLEAIRRLKQTDWGMGNAGIDAHSVYNILEGIPPWIEVKDGDNHE